MSSSSARDAAPNVGFDQGNKRVLIQAGFCTIDEENENMLTTLRIRNLALVAELGLELDPGYNVITGETGAGKSILIGALNLLLGERADRTLIRSGTDQCTVEGVFDVKGLGEPFQEFLVE